jgi:hypothetical protein
MTAKIKLLRSVVAGHVPATLESGQVAINEADDKLFWRHSDGTIKSIDMTLALIATQAWVTTQIGDLIASAPGALNTLDELAAALGDDANFAATVTAALGNRVRFDAAQTLDAGQKTQARNNIGAGTSSFDGAYSSLTGKPTLGSAAALDVGTTANTVAAGNDTRLTNAVQKTGDEVVNGIKTFGAIPVGPANDPTTDNQLARKAYVDAHGGQPVPTSSSSFAVGTVLVAFIKPASGTVTVTDGATTSGSNLKIGKLKKYMDGSFGVDVAGATLTGTWKNITGVTLDGSASLGEYCGGFWVRTA